MKSVTVLVIAGLVLINSQQSHADIKTDLLICKSIKSNADRLNCFDAIVKSHSDTATTKITGNQTKIIESSSTTQLTPQLKKVEVTRARRESQQALISSKPNNFGMEQVDQDTKIESFLLGEFSRWKKGMKLKLKNGQIWKVTSARNGYKRLTDPAITISRGVFGSFDAKIEGLNARAKVKRIK